MKKLGPKLFPLNNLIKNLGCRCPFYYTIEWNLLLLPSYARSNHERAIKTYKIVLHRLLHHLIHVYHRSSPPSTTSQVSKPATIENKIKPNLRSLSQWHLRPALPSTFITFIFILLRIRIPPKHQSRSVITMIINIMNLNQNLNENYIRFSRSSY